MAEWTGDYRVAAAGSRVPPARAARLRAARRRRAGRAGRPAGRHRVDVRAPVGQRRRLRARSSAAAAGTRSRRRGRIRLGWVLRGGHADLAQPMGHRATADRMPRGARLSSRAAPRGRAAPGRRPNGAARVGWCSKPRAGFGRRPPSCGRSRQLAGRTGDCASAGGRRAGRRDRAGRERRWSSTLRAARANITTSSSRSSRRPAPAEPPDAGEAVAAPPSGAGRRRSRPLDDSLAPRDARHACAVLRGLTSAGGGMVAAATTSLPERAEQGRNYDYRYAWIRDQCYAGQAAAAAGPDALLDNAVRFVTRAAARGRPRSSNPAYTVTAERSPTSGGCDLPGYPGGSDIVGNWVNKQFQLDAFGEALLLLAAADRHDRLDADGWRAAGSRSTRSRNAGTEPDAGIWEIEPPALDAQPPDLRRRPARRGRAAARRPAAGDGPGWPHASLAGHRRRRVHPVGRWQRAPDDSRVDAALLLPAIRGAAAAGRPAHAGDAARRTQPSSPRTVTPTGSGMTSGRWATPRARSCCAGSSWRWHCTSRASEIDAARWFERNRAACGPPGLFAEEYDVTAAAAARQPAAGVRACAACSRSRRPAGRPVAAAVTADPEEGGT